MRYVDGLKSCHSNRHWYRSWYIGRGWSNYRDWDRMRNGYRDRAWDVYRIGSIGGYRDVAVNRDWDGLWDTDRDLAYSHGRGSNYWTSSHTNGRPSCQSYPPSKAQAKSVVTVVQTQAVAVT
jgi:hypothetical protein